MEVSIIVSIVFSTMSLILGIPAMIVAIIAIKKYQDEKIELKKQKLALANLHHEYKSLLEKQNEIQQEMSNCLIQLVELKKTEVSLKEYKKNELSFLFNINQTKKQLVYDGKNKTRIVSERAKRFGQKNKLNEMNNPSKKIMKKHEFQESSENK